MDMFSKKTEAQVTKIEEIVKDTLVCIGEDPKRTGLVDTPKRVAKMFGQIFMGYNPENKPRIQTFPNGEDGVTYDQLLLDSGYYFSHCEHHMVPFFGDYYFGYIPNKTILGLSKVARIVDFHSARLQIAERLCHNIVDDLWNACEPLGMILVLQGRHLCKEMRGVRKYNSPCESHAAKGILLHNSSGCKDEFMSRIPKLK